MYYDMYSIIDIICIVLLCTVYNKHFSIIKIFDCEKIYILIRGFVRLIEYEEEKIIMKEEVLYDQIIRIIFGNSFSIKVLLRTEDKKRFHNHNSFFSFPFNFSKSEIVYF